MNDFGLTYIWMKFIDDMTLKQHIFGRNLLTEWFVGTNIWRKLFSRVCDQIHLMLMSLPVLSDSVDIDLVASSLSGK